MILALIASHSRAAFLSFLVSFIYLMSKRYKFSRKTLFNQSLIKKTGIITAIFVLTSCFLTGLYIVKKDSANGRLLIWEVSVNMIREKPFFGFGFDRFKANYMDYQASFFAQHPRSHKEMVAGDTNYAFNEPLQITVENGIIGFFMMTSVFASVFLSRKKRHQVKQKFLTAGVAQRKDFANYDIIAIAKAGLINILIFSLFSYPSQILPIKTSLVLFLATVVNNNSTNIMYVKFLNNKGLIQAGQYIKSIFFLAFAVLTFVAILFINKLILSYSYWHSANQFYQFDAYQASLSDYREAYYHLNTNGDFLTNYGKALSESKNYSKAIAILERGRKLYPNAVVYTALGNSYKALGLYNKAEHAYLYAWQMNPSRFYPKYLLAILYRDTGQKVKAVAVANELLQKKAKVESEAIREIKHEMNEIIKKNSVKK